MIGDRARGGDAAVARDRLASRVARIAGAVFVLASLPKFLGYGWELDQFRRFGLPQPEVWVIAAGVLELVGGTLLMLRRLVVPAAVVLAGVMVVAITTSGIKEGDVIPSLTVAPVLLAAVAFVAVRGLRGLRTTASDRA